MPSPRPKMRKFRCPSCDEKFRTTAMVVAHRCKFNKNKLTHFEEVTDD